MTAILLFVSSQFKHSNRFNKIHLCGSKSLSKTHKDQSKEKIG